MKVELKNNDSRKGRGYPKLMISSGTDRVWLVVDEGIGISLYTGPEDHREIGHYTETLNMDILEDYEGSICLSND